jgi:alpha-tubulin suppressor-like RCC1 family protein
MAKSKRGFMGSVGYSFPWFSRTSTLCAVVLVLGCTDSTGPGAPAGLEFEVQPVSTIATKLIEPAVVVAVVDARGRRVRSATNSVTLTVSLNSGSGALVGTTAVAAIDGIATFTNIAVNKTGAAYTLSAASPGLKNAISVPFSVGTGAAAKLGFTSQPSSTFALSKLPPFSVAVQDTYGNTVSSTLSVAISFGNNPGAATMSGNLVRIASAGVATFNDVSIDKPGTGYTLSASIFLPPGQVSTLGGATSSPFDITVGAAAKIVFGNQPSVVRPGDIIPTLTALIQDNLGNTIPGANNLITVAIGANPGNASLSGTLAVAAVNGVATFSDLKINNAGNGYTLTANAQGLTAATTRGFSVRDFLVFRSVTAGYFQTCGVTVKDAAFCWGQNISGQVGNGTNEEARTAEPVSSGLTFTSVTSGRTHNCGVTRSGSGYCWGSNNEGNLGNGATQSNVPAQIVGANSYLYVSAGYAHSCGISSANLAYCWGDNERGALGDGTQVQRDVPGPVSGGLTFVSMSAGRLFTCALASGGIPYCWGDNVNGQLGDGSVVRRLLPAKIASESTFVQIGAGGFHSCALTAGGQAYCWGSNSEGQLGDGTVTTRIVPTKVAPNITFASISVGNRHNCGITAAGVAYCWGENSYGTVGDGTTANRTSPVPVAGGLTFASISAGRFHTCGVTVSGDAYCWGENFSGILGDGTIDGKRVPTRVR